MKEGLAVSSTIVSMYEMQVRERGEKKCAKRERESVTKGERERKREGSGERKEWKRGIREEERVEKRRLCEMKCNGNRRINEGK